MCFKCDPDHRNVWREIRCQHHTSLPDILSTYPSDLFCLVFYLKYKKNINVQSAAIINGMRKNMISVMFVQTKSIRNIYMLKIIRLEYSNSSNNDQLYNIRWLLLNFYFSYTLGNTHLLERKGRIQIEQTCGESLKWMSANKVLFGKVVFFPSLEIKYLKTNVSREFSLSGCFGNL